MALYLEYPVMWSFFRDKYYSLQLLPKIGNKGRTKRNKNSFISIT